MGLFGSTKTFVASTVYNMAGDINDRPNFLKTLVIGKVIQGLDRSQTFGGAIVAGYLTGPGIRLRNFGRWAEENYDQVGVVRATFVGQNAVTSEAISALIPHASDQTVGIQRSEINSADPTYWAEQWMLQNHADEIDTAWTSDYDDLANEVIVTRQGGIALRFTPAEFDRSATYLYVFYTLLAPGEEILNPEDIDD